MKKINFLFVIFLLTVDVSQAQITITQNDLPQAGSTYIVSTDTTPSVALGTPGPTAQSWNFISLSQDYPSVPTYGYTSWTPYASAYPTSNIYTYGPAALYSSLAGGAPVGTQGMNKGYMFWRTDYSGFHIIGFRSDSGTYSNVNVQDNPTELLIGTPATYGTSFNNVGVWTFPMNINPLDYDTFYTSHIVKTLTADAWGDITTPSGNFPSVLRIHEYYVKTDSVYVRYNNLLIYSAELIRDTANNYLFIANNIHYPVAIAHANASNNVTSVEYYVGVLSSVNAPVLNNFSSAVYPNPFEENCRINLPVDFCEGASIQLTITDLAGKIVRSENYPPGDFIAFEKEELSEGIFIYSAKNKNGNIICGKLNITK